MAAKKKINDNHVDLNVKQNIFVYKDKRLGTYSRPIFTDVERDSYAKNAVKAALTANPTERAYAKDQVLYFVGVYNDGSAKFETQEPELVVDLGDYIHE